MKNSIAKKITFSATSVLLLFIVWIIVSTINSDKQLIYPSITNIFQTVLKCFNEEGLKSFFFTFLRVMQTIIASFIVSVLIIILYIKFPSSYSFFSPLIKMMRTIPFICISFFIIIIFDDQIAPYIIGFLLIIPIIVEGIKSGIDLMDKNIKDDMALLEIGFWNKLLKVYLPLMMPTIVVALLQTFGLGFKVIIMGECFAQTENSLGMMLYLARDNYLMNELIAWTIIIVVIVSVVEILINYFNRKRNNFIY